MRSQLLLHTTAAESCSTRCCCCSLLLWYVVLLRAWVSRCRYPNTIFLPIPPVGTSSCRTQASLQTCAFGLRARGCSPLRCFACFSGGARHRPPKRSSAERSCGRRRRQPLIWTPWSEPLRHSSGSASRRRGGGQSSSAPPSAGSTTPRPGGSTGARSSPSSYAWYVPRSSPTGLNHLDRRAQLLLSQSASPRRQTPRHSCRQRQAIRSHRGPHTVAGVAVSQESPLHTEQYRRED